MSQRFGLTLIILTCFVLVLGCAPISAAQPPPPTGSLTVAIMETPPFVMKRGERYTGFSIDLWEDIARRNGWNYEYVHAESLASLLELVSKSQVDLGIADISITHEREQSLDFSYPIFDSGLQVMVSEDHGRVSLGHILHSIASPTLLFILGMAVLLIVVVSHIVWFVERRDNPEFDRNYLRGIWEAIWWSTVTQVTVGYGDKSPRTFIGRAVTIVFMFLSVVVIANFTAVVTTEIALRGLFGMIDDVDDLHGKAIATVRDTTTDAYLKHIGITPLLVSHIEEAYTMLESGKVDAVVYDSPVLLYYAAGRGRGKVKVLPGTFAKLYQAIALPPASPIQEDVNLALIEAIEDGTYAEIHDRWFKSAQP